MTVPPVDPLADALAELSELRETVDTLTADRDATQARLAEMADALADIATAFQAAQETGSAEPEDIDPQNAADGDQDDDGAPEDEEEAPLCWVSLSGSERAGLIVALARWYRDILQARYPLRLENIKPCWPLHPAAVEELTWLYGQWKVVWVGEDARYYDAGEWHDRWFPGVLDRLAKEFSACGTDANMKHYDALRAVELHDRPDVIPAGYAEALRQDRAPDFW